MLPTVEVRWFLSGPVPPAMRIWLDEVAPAAVAQPKRTDRYLLLGSRADVGIKLREGRLEIKHCLAELGTARLSSNVQARIAHWVKWGFPLPEAETAAIDSSRLWLPVGKERLLQRFRLAAAGIEPLPDSERPHSACDVEMTTILVGGQTWWSLAFEAFGGPDAGADELRQLLEQVATCLLAKPVPMILSLGDSLSYPAWLHRLGNPNRSIET
jgi:hypothetical protein